MRSKSTGWREPPPPAGASRRYSAQLTFRMCGRAPDAFARVSSATISSSVAAGRSVVRATSPMVAASALPQAPSVTQVSTIRSETRAAISGQTWRVKRDSDDAIPAVSAVWCSSPTPSTSGAGRRGVDVRGREHRRDRLVQRRRRRDRERAGGRRAREQQRREAPRPAAPAAITTPPAAAACSARAGSRR